MQDNGRKLANVNTSLSPDKRKVFQDHILKASAIFDILNVFKKTEYLFVSVFALFSFHQQLFELSPIINSLFATSLTSFRKICGTENGFSQ